MRADPDARARPDAADTVLGRLPELAGTERRLQLLTGGLTNRNYRVSLGSGDEYVARFSGARSNLLAIDRDAEYRNSVSAARAGVGPDVVAYAPEHGVLIVKWINGRTLGEKDLDDAAQLDRVAQSCRQLHAGPRFVGDFDMFDVQRRYLEIVRGSGFRLPDDYLSFEPALRHIEQALRASASSSVPCHNDLLAANIIDDGTRLWLIDYEYAGNNDPCFELGNIAAESHLPDDALAELVTAYYGKPLRNKIARARLLGLAGMYGWTLWGAIQHSASPIEYDFWSWAMERFEGAARGFTTASFETLLEDVQRDD
jgi:thiamine kinase-like enzyme